MIQQRNMAMQVLLVIVTLGVYTIYGFYVTYKEMMEHAKEMLFDIELGKLDIGLEIGTRMKTTVGRGGGLIFADFDEFEEADYFKYYNPDSRPKRNEDSGLN